jgi:hypothetical protein
MKRARIRAYHMQNSCTTIAIKLVLRWLHSRHCMDDSIEHHCSGVKLMKVFILRGVTLAPYS